MKLTVHGGERIESRTKMWGKDLLNLLSKKAYVDLGSNGKYRYLLFHSLVDHSAKIAVVNRECTHLVSIWNHDFHLPDSIAPLTRLALRTAKHKSLAALAQQSVRKPLPPKTSGEGQVVVSVFLNSRKIVRHDCGLVSLKIAGTQQSLLEFLKPTLETLVDSVNANWDMVHGVLYYDIKVKHEVLSQLIKT
jgi:hypothetical protein